MKKLLVLLMVYVSLAGCAATIRLNPPITRGDRAIPNPKVRAGLGVIFVLSDSYYYFGGLHGQIELVPRNEPVLAQEVIGVLKKPGSPISFFKYGDLAKIILNLASQKAKLVFMNGQVLTAGRGTFFYEGYGSNIARDAFELWMVFPAGKTFAFDFVSRMPWGVAETGSFSVSPPTIADSGDLRSIHQLRNHNGRLIGWSIQLYSPRLRGGW